MSRSRWRCSPSSRRSTSWRRAIANWRVGLAAFVVGWVFQGIGHAVYEKNKPAFVKNLVHLMVGPVFLINELLGLRPVHAPVK